MIERYNKKSLFVYLFFTMKNEKWERRKIERFGHKKRLKEKKNWEESKIEREKENLKEIKNLEEETTRFGVYPSLIFQSTIYLSQLKE